MLILGRFEINIFKFYMIQLVIVQSMGDEGKGKIVDMMAAKADLVVRFHGGNNAGHTVVINGKNFLFI